MKQRTRVLSFVMAILLVLGAVLSPLIPYVNTQAEASDSKYRIVLNTQPMTGSLGESFPFSYANYNCMTNNPQIIASAGYTNVISYCADADGFLRVDDLKVWIGGSDYTTVSREVEFAVIDDAGVILTNQGKIATINSNNYMKSGLSVDAIEIKKGECLYFVFHGNVGAANSPRCNAKIMYSSDGKTWSQKNSTGLLWASTNTNNSAKQGEENFYYNYSTTYVKEKITQDSVGIAYKEMTGSRTGFPFMYKNMHCMTNLPEIIVSKGYTNIVAYQMPFDGQIKLEELKVWIANKDLSTTERAFEFAVTDSTGKVLSNDGKLVTVNSTNSSKDGMKVDALTLKKGEKLYFIFNGTNGSTSSLRCSTNIMLSADGTVWTQASQEKRDGVFILWPAGATSNNVKQGQDNFYYGYSDIYVTHTYTAPKPQEPVQTTIPGTATVPEANKDGYMPTYKLDMELADMVSSTVHKDFPLSMPGKEYDCMTNPKGNQIVSPGYANVITYKVQKAGAITLKNITAGISSNSGVALFAITDKDGNILYPSDKTFVVFDKDQKSVSGSFLQNYNVKVGDEIRFVFEGVEGKTTACWVRGIMVQFDSADKETRLTIEDGGYMAPFSGKTGQGEDGFHYQYAKSFKNEQTGYVTPPVVDVIPGTATLPVANEEGHMPTYKLNMELADMVSSTVHKDFPLSMPGKEYDCMTNPIGNQIVSQGYANVITYKVQKAGSITLKNMTAGISSDSSVVLFAITDKDGNVLYPSDKTLAVFNKDHKSVSGVFLREHKVSVGDEIRFVFEGVEGKTTACWVRGIMVLYDSAGKETRLTREDGGYMAPVSGKTGQTEDGFHYQYAKSFKNEQTGYAIPPEPEVLPGNPVAPKANEKGLVPKYRISFEAADMISSKVHPNFPLSMPDKEYDCMTNPAGNQIVSEGYANIITYKVQKSGKLTLKNMTAGISVKNAPENVVLFAITDKKGNVIYPSDGTLVVLDKDNETAVGTFLSNYAVKKGDEINFIFQGVKGKTVACRVRGIMISIDSNGKETRLTREDGGYIAPISGSTKQGASGFSYRYAKKFENIILGWVKPKSKAVQWGKGIEVVVSKNPEDFVYYSDSSTSSSQEGKVNVFEVIKEELQLRNKFIPWVIAATGIVALGAQCIVFFTKKGKGDKSNEKNN